MISYKKILVNVAILVCFFIPFSSAAHYIVGFVGDALDGEPADGHTILLWNPSSGISDNITEIIGPSGSSGTLGYYMFDCEMLSRPCEVGDSLSLAVISNGDRYISAQTSLAVSGSGYDQASNLIINSPPSFLNLIADDSNSLPGGEIDLFAGSNQLVECSAAVTDMDGEGDIKNASAVFFDISNSAYSSLDDNNNHYTNQSCILNLSYGDSKTAQVKCSWMMPYYANSGNWNCTMSVFDNLSVYSRESNLTFINSLLAINISDEADFGTISSSAVTHEFVINISNFGNVGINLSFKGYGAAEGDGFAMNCTSGSDRTIPIYYEKYNLTSSNPGILNLNQFERFYKNLSADSVTEPFNLAHRQSESFNEAVAPTYWRVYAPQTIGGSCAGNLVISAVRS